MLVRARQLSDIRSANAPTFRLRLSFSLTDKHLDTIRGTYDEVWISKSRWRRETIVSGLKWIEITTPTKRWLALGGKDFPEQATRVPALVEMLPAKADGFQFDSVTDKDSVTQCAITKPGAARHQKYAFCFDKNGGALVGTVTPLLVGQRVADYSCRYGDFRKFGSYWFPREMACYLDTHQVMEATVDELVFESSPNAALFNPPTEAVEMENCSVEPVPPQLMSSPAAKLPPDAQSRRSSVGLWMIIDLQGNPKDIKIAKSGGEPFDDVASGAVRKWHFRPGSCEGRPFAMPISFEVRFQHSD